MNTRRNIWQESIPLRGELLAHWLPGLAPLWLTAAVMSLLLGVVWRLTASAPAPLELAAMLSATVWLLALPLFPRWQRLLRRESALAAGSVVVWRSLWLLLLGLGSAYALVLAFSGLGLAYDADTAYFVAKPIDVDAQPWSSARLLWWMLRTSAVPWCLLSLASLTLLATLVRRHCVLLWLSLGLALHLSALTSGALDLPLSPSGITSLLVTNLSSADAVLLDHMLAPVHTRLALLWLCSLSALVIALLFRPTAQPAASALGHAVLAGFAAAALRAAILGQQWVHDPGALRPDTLSELMSTGLVVTIGVWAALAALQPRNALFELRRAWWQPLLLGPLLLPLTVALLAAGAASQAGALAAAGTVLLLGCACLGGLALVWRLVPALQPERAVALALPLLGLTLALLSLRTADGLPLPEALLEALHTAVLLPEQRTPALLVSAACFTLATAGAFLPRRLALSQPASAAHAG